MVSLTFPYLTFKTDVFFLLTKQHLLHKKIWLWSFYTHICASPFILMAGATQFSQYILSKYKKIHRFAGNVYIVLILFVSAPSGLVMAFYANGGIAAQLSFIVISILWWWFTWVSWRCIKNGDVSGHKNFIRRSYALTLSAITLRVYILIARKFIPIDGAIIYILASWLSWAPNLILSEWIIWREQHPRKQTM